MSSQDTLIHRLIWFNDHETLDAFLTENLGEQDVEEASLNLSSIQGNSFAVAAADDATSATASAATTATSPTGVVASSTAGRTASKTQLVDKKYRGMAPIHLAIQFGHDECVDVLLKHGASMFAITELGFQPLQEATSLGDRVLMRKMLLARHEQIRHIIHGRQAHLHQVVKEEVPSFYLEMNWDFKSWVPFFSMLCPSDCYKIWKKGNRLRIDTTLLGFDKLHWLRGNVSYLFAVEEDGSSFYVLDHDRKIWQHVRNLRDFTEKEIEEDLNLRLNQEIVSARLDTHKSLRFSRARTLMGLGDEYEEDIGAYRTRVYNIENLDWVTRTRKEHLRDRPEGDLSAKTSSWFLGYGGRTPYSHICSGGKSRGKGKASSTAASAGDAAVVEEQQGDEDSFYSLSATDTSTETLYKESVKKISAALNNATPTLTDSDSGDDEDEVDSADLTGIKDHLPDFDPNQIDGLLEDSAGLAQVHTPSLAPPQNRLQVPFEEFFAPINCDNQDSLPYIHLGRPLACQAHRKHLNASLWMSNEFPLTIAQLLPLFEIMSPSNEAVDKVREFISIKLPPGFPVQLELPVLLFLTARITFRNFLLWNRETRKMVPVPPAMDPILPSDLWFQVPKDYREGVVIRNIFKKSDQRE